jgi:hypothetical protein
MFNTYCATTLARERQLNHFSWICVSLAAANATGADPPQPTKKTFNDNHHSRYSYGLDLAPIKVHTSTMAFSPVT